MAVIKCKMCGGDLILTEGQTVAECEYCGSRQTVPTADNEKKTDPVCPCKSTARCLRV